MLIIHGMKLNFFFDVDGTIVPFGRNIPESAVRAMHDAKAKGHRLFLSTGRAPYEVTDSVLALPLDGGVHSSGAEVVLNGKSIYRRFADDRERKAFKAVAEKYDLLWFIPGPENTYTTKRTMEVYRRISFENNGGEVQLTGLKMVDSIPDIPMVKFYILSDKGLIMEARRELEGILHCENNTTGFPMEAAAEVTIPGISKASGIEIMVRHLGESMDSTVGVGDGENDIRMVSACHLGIAMGNACQQLKDCADYVTSDIDDDGLAKAIYYAMEKFG